MTTPAQMSPRDEATVSAGVLSSGSTAGALATGAVFAAGDLGLQVLHGHVGLGAIGGAGSLGVSVFFVVLAASALLRARGNRAARWAANHPWRFAALPGVSAAVLVLVLSVLVGGGVFGGLWAAAWHGALVYGLAGAVGSVAGSRRRRP
ncbi:MAG TPA: hypothetical protein VH478_19985 [Trebonia sp.]|jgi:hypothetical protein|nr:hypothetical protein [Trebonia sp.]